MSDRGILLRGPAPGVLRCAFRGNVGTMLRKTFGTEIPVPRLKLAGSGSCSVCVTVRVPRKCRDRDTYTFRSGSPVPRVCWCRIVVFRDGMRVSKQGVQSKMVWRQVMRNQDLIKICYII